MPFVLEYFKSKGKLGNCILFVTIFGAVFCFAHGAGFLQAVDTIAYGGPGICVPALPGAPKDIDTKAMCDMMAIHIFLMLAMGIFLTTLALNSARRLPKGNLDAVYYSRAALFFLVGGISQDIPYFAVILQYPERFGEFMTMDGFYSARWITPGFTEFGAPIVWIVYGLYSYVKLMSMIDATSIPMM